MCELLAMSANTPTDIRFSFTGLVERGGATADHGDGWGIAFHEGRRCRQFHDPVSSARSPVARFVREASIPSEIVVSHIRRANRGRVCLANTHPFERELHGRSWSFAHNGQLRGVKRWPLTHYLPMGTTDSEHAFCWLLDQVRSRYPARAPRPAALRRFLAARCAELGRLGVFNMLLSDGRALYVHCSTRLCWLTRRAPFGEARLRDAEVRVDFGAETTPDDIVSVIATEPLTANERWQAMERGSLVAFESGLPVWSQRTGAACPQSARLPARTTRRRQ